MKGSPKSTRTLRIGHTRSGTAQCYASLRNSMSQELIDLWIHFLTSKDLDSTFLDIIYLANDIYPDLADVGNSAECKYVIEMINKHESNPVLAPFFKP
jgi:hypothetical protein